MVTASRFPTLLAAVLATGLLPPFGSAHEPAVSFRNHVMAVFSKAGCNTGACHGNMNGKGGFRLSLRGQDPAADHREVTRTLGGRRVNTLLPEESILLRKPLMQVPHQGGKRFAKNSRMHQILTDWIRGGAVSESGDAAVEELVVSPGQATLQLPDGSLQLQAIARKSDGSSEDVTSLAVYESSDPEVKISADGLLRSERAGVTVITVRYLHLQQPVRVEFVADRPDYEFRGPPRRGPVDAAVFAQLERLKITPAPLSDDATFVRRVHLDLTGLLPGARAARRFVESEDPDKRNQLIDQLLRSEEFNDHQTQMWADLLRVEDKTLDSRGVQVFHDWIRESIATEKPLNEFIRELITARGSTYEVAPANFYRALRQPDQRAESCAQLFLGIRLQCAKCHNHPFSRWTQDDYYDWTNLFARIDYEIVENNRRDKNDKHEFNGEQIVQVKDEGDVRNPSTGKVAGLRFLDVTARGADGAVIDDGGDRLEQLAAWLTAPNNRRFAEMQANRIWYQLMGRGVVDPIDDFRTTNPPVNPELLEVLTSELIDSEFSVRHLVRLIVTSSAYQLAAEPNPTSEPDGILFSYVVPRRLKAEQLLDGVALTLDSDVEYGGHEAGIRAVQLVGVRNGGNRYSRPEAGDRFLQLFGRPNRLQTCECERSGETTLTQTFEMVSGELLAGLIGGSQSRIGRAVAGDQSTAEFLDALYWTALCRPPSDRERDRLVTFVDQAEDRRMALEDVTWAVLNSNEFLLRR